MNKKTGFTLFELLVSISIIAIMTALAIVSFSAAQKKARDARRMQDMGLLGKAAEMFYAANSASYPTTWSGSWIVSGQTILETFPQDPKGVGYTAPTTQTTSAYCFCAFMEGAKGNSSDRNCTFSNAITNNWYCVKNQQ